MFASKLKVRPELALARWLALWLALLPGCAGTPPAVAIPAGMGALPELLTDAHAGVPRTVPTTVEEIAALPLETVVVFVAETPDVPVAAGLDAPARAALGDWLRRGGRMLLLGYASRLVFELGLEERPPDRCEPMRWGYDDRTRLGRLRYGVQRVTGQLDELFEGLQPEPDRAHVFALGGGELVDTQGCFWEGYEPAQGKVLGRLAGERDGRPETSPAVALALWRCGTGAVLACGVLPELQRDATTADNARRFVENALKVLGRGDGAPELQLWIGASGEEHVPPASMPPLAEREIPGMSLISHWGWQVSTSYLRDDPVGPRSVIDEVLVPSWQAGADLLDLHLADPRAGYPLPWAARDPLRRPESYRGNLRRPWSADAVGDLAVECHSRGMLLQSWLAPAPVSPGEPAAALAALRWLARDLCDLRSLGERALDGLGVHAWLADPWGYTLAVLQDFQPGGHLFATDTEVQVPRGALPVNDAGDGRPLGVNAAGLSSQWRALRGDAFVLGQLDCRTARPSVARWGAEHARGGGSYGDWLVVQINDFVRARIGRAPALWWQAFDPDTMDPANAAYVHGISSDPIRAAVAARLWATGRGGYRQRVAQLVDELQSGFGADAPQPSHSHFLQNNHFRLHGTGGGLFLDPGGLARFGVGQAVPLTDGALMTTRLFGSKPSAGELRIGTVDFLEGGQRAAGGYGTELYLDLQGGAAPFPQVLGRESMPQWPRRVTLMFRPELGLHQLDLRLRAVRGQGVVELRREDELVQVFTFAEGGGSVEHVLPFHVAQDGARTLTLDVVDGGTVAVEVLRLTRIGDVAAETRIESAAGHRGALTEWTASSYHADRTEVVTAADLPGFALSIECGRVARQLQMRREFHLRHHRNLVHQSGDDGPRSLRGPFVLGADEPGVPDLVVVPVELPRYTHFELTDTGQLLLEGQPAAFQSIRVGFLLVPEADPEMLPHLPRAFAELLDPPRLELSQQGEAVLTCDLPFPWVRLLQMADPPRTPYLVRENGYWVHRGGQASAPGAQWLRVHHLPGDTVHLLAGAAMMRRTRPGPGSLHCVALRDPEPDAVTVVVLQVSPLAAAPCVTMAADFDEVAIDGRPWSYFDGRNVYLPRQMGTYRVTTRSHGGGTGPTLVRTRADVQHCRWDASRHELSILTRAADERPADLPYTAWIAGPEPVAIDGGTRIPEDDFPYPDSLAAEHARRAGFLVRFRPGLLRIHYGDG